MTASQIMAALRPLLGDRITLHIAPLLPDSVLSSVTIDSDDDARMIGFVDFPKLASALGVTPTDIQHRVITTSVWSENDHQVKKHYDLEFVVTNVICEDFVA